MPLMHFHTEMKPQILGSKSSLWNKTFWFWKSTFRAY